MKYKFKPAARVEIRERLEKKFRARGAVVFHLLVMLGAGILLLYNLPDLLAPTWDRLSFLYFWTLYGLLCMTGALHYTHYYFRHGRGRERHEAETEARIERRLRQSAPEEADEQEELVRIQANDQLKNRRLLWQHLAIYTGATLTVGVGHAGNMPGIPLFAGETWRGFIVLFSFWGIGLAAHALRYVFAYRLSAERREAKIDAQVARELRHLEAERDGGATDNLAWRSEYRAIERVEEAQTPATLRAQER